jgi:hypothetical protein
MGLPTPIIDNYDLYFKFIEEALTVGFKDIDRMNPLITKLEKLTESNNQFFFVSDLIQLEIKFTSRRSVDILGFEPGDFDPFVLFNSLHPDDRRRYTSAQETIFRLGQKIFIKGKGNLVISGNFRFKDSSGEYSNILVQCYLFYTEIPYKTVFMLEVLTDISWFKNLIPGHHFYLGRDSSFFRYPDEYFLQMGNIFTPGNLRSMN